MAHASEAFRPPGTLPTPPFLAPDESIDAGGWSGSGNAFDSWASSYALPHVRRLPQFTMELSLGSRGRHSEIGASGSFAAYPSLVSPRLVVDCVQRPRLRCFHWGANRATGHRSLARKADQVSSPHRYRCDTGISARSMHRPHVYLKLKPTDRVAARLSPAPTSPRCRPAMRSAMPSTLLGDRADTRGGWAKGAPSGSAGKVRLCFPGKSP
jgi:hypothetical protein